MPWNCHTRGKARKTQAPAWVFLCLVTTGSFLIAGPARPLESNPPSSSTIKDELTTEERKKMIDQLLVEGDQHLAAKNYNIANATYESIFLLEPNNTTASKRIDRLKKELLGEGRSETELITRVYDSEVEERVREYLERAKRLIAEQKWGQARFTLQKLLLLNPLHEEASKLYKEINQKAQEHSS